MREVTEKPASGLPREGSLGSTAAPSVPDLLPARMLNEFVYCPRLAYLEWVQGEWAESADTVEGRFHHRRVNRSPSRTGAPVEAEPLEEIHARSVHLSSERLGLTAKIDLVEGEGGRATPVEYKRGKRPHTAHGAWEPERVQLCVQGLLLREHGFVCEEGILYFAGSRERVRVRFDEELVSRTLQFAEEMRRVIGGETIPPPLEDSPKCPRCSLVSICLPDEIRFLNTTQAAAEPPRRLLPSADDALPMYVQRQGARVVKDGEVLRVLERDERLAEARLREISQLAVFGGVQLTSSVIRELCMRGIPICHFSHGGWFYGVTHGMFHKNVELRRRQYAAAADPEKSLVLARRFVQAKILNCRTLLRRNHKELPPEVLEGFKADLRRAARTEDLESLLGVEGTAASRYFARFGEMLRQEDGLPTFDFSQRNRRPPRDPVNALLSFAYAMLVKDFAATLFTVGFDPYLGFFHKPRYGRPALALDLMEEFRPLIADSVVLTVINNGEIRAEHFIRSWAGVALTQGGRLQFLRAYERRMAQEIVHPVFGYRISYRRVLEVQARLLGRYLMGEIADYPSFLTR
ncbi:MAG TPA: CRISPR-associated endonuclease Cas1 [Candidatus Acidoferrales bacterium]|nr:CRISPR-associated endonuclease Cas1 [Candidatus Acidoferrales bacterium]